MNMTRFIRKNKKEIGLSPDALIFRGQKKIDQVLLRIIDFDSKNLTEEELKTVKEVSEFQHKNTVTWMLELIHQ